MRTAGLATVLAATLSATSAFSKGTPSETWTNAEIYNGVCFVERDYKNIRIALIEGKSEYSLILEISEKNIEIGKKYDAKLGFPNIYENSISGIGLDSNRTYFKDVFPTLIGNFMISDKFSIYFVGHIYGEFNLSGSSKSVQSLINCKEGLKAEIQNSAPTLPSEWWQDSFIWDESAQDCGGNDSISTYSAKKVEFWESACSIRKVTPLKEIDAVILDMKCDGLPEEGTWSRRQILMELEGGKIASFPPLQKLKRCSSQKDTPAAPAKSECDFNSRFYRSPIQKDPDPNSYQELQFTTGTADGKANLTEYRQGKAAWTAHGTHTCSNGASICRITFPSMLGQPVELAYETVDDASKSPEMVVIPALRQEVYQTEQHAVTQGKAYGGLVVDFLNGFMPKEGELTLPYNVYRYAGCKQ